MRIVVHGQEAFGKAVLEALVERGENIVGAFCAPDKAGRPEDPLKVFAREKGLTVHQPKSWRTPEALELMKSFNADLCVMAYVTLWVPDAVVHAPKFGSIQYHPSLLPLHRGPSSINWAIATGRAETGLTIFEPNEGLDEGPVILQKRVDIGPDETLGDVYFKKLFPLGVAAMLETVDLVKSGKVTKTPQDHSRATYESWFKKEQAAIDWSRPVTETYNIIRAANPQPGAWTRWNGAEVQIFDVARGLAQSKGGPGEVLAIDANGMLVAANGGSILVKRVRVGGAKEPAQDYAKAANLKVGDKLESIPRQEASTKS
jgi:methionyl-tRNA formyltransferase